MNQAINADDRAAYWDRIIEFHEKMEKKFPSGRAGLEAIQTIRRVLGSRWEPSRPGIASSFGPGQALESRFWVGYEPNYRWLIHFAAKLEALLRISGHEFVLEQFSSPALFTTALMEMDFGLKVSLSGIQCKYDLQRSRPTPDLVAVVNGDEVDIEITSLNRPYEDTAGIAALSSVPMIAIQAKCQAGGIWARIPSKKELDSIKKKVQAAVVEATAKRRLVEINEPGVLSCFIAPEDMAAQTQAPWQWGSFVMRTRSRLPKKDRLARTIEEKARGQLSRGRPSILVVYDLFSRPEEARDFLNEKEIELTVGAFSNLAGVILVCPFVTAFMIGLEWISQGEETRENRTLVEYALPDNEAEICTIWRHLMGKHRPVIETITQCLVDFPKSLEKLYGEP